MKHLLVAMTLLLSTQAFAKVSGPSVEVKNFPQMSAKWTGIEDKGELDAAMTACHRWEQETLKNLNSRGLQAYSSTCTAKAPYDADQMGWITGEVQGTIVLFP